MHKLALRIAAATALTVAAPAFAANQFDLKCTGTQEKRTGTPPVAWSETFRIDLDARRWCRGACKTAAAISSITADEITIADSRATIGGPADTMLSISRTTGQVREYVEAGWSGAAFDLAKGTCTRDLYSGLPGAKF